MPAPTSQTLVILAQTTTSTPAVTYDRYWVGFQVLPPHPDQPIAATVTLRKYGRDAEGNAHFDPTAQPIVFRVDDVLEEAQANTSLAEAYAKVLAAVELMAASRGLI